MRRQPHHRRSLRRQGRPRPRPGSAGAGAAGDAYQSRPRSRRLRPSQRKCSRTRRSRSAGSARESRARGCAAPPCGASGRAVSRAGRRRAEHRLHAERQPVQQPQHPSRTARHARLRPRADAAERAACARPARSGEYRTARRRALRSGNRRLPIIAVVAELLNYLRGDANRTPLKRSPLLQSPGRQTRVIRGPHESTALEFQRVERLPLHLRIGLRRPSRQGRRPDLRRDPRRDLRAGPALARRRRDAVQHRPGRARRRDHDQRARRLHPGRARHDQAHRLRQHRLRHRLQGLRGDGLLRQAEQRHRAGRRPGQRRPPQQRRRRPGPDVRLRLRRDARAHAGADLLRAPPRRAPGAAAQGRPPAVPAPRREEPGHDALRRRQAALDRHRRALDPARARDERRHEDEGGVRTRR